MNKVASSDTGHSTTKAHRQGMIRTFVRNAPARSQREMLRRLRTAGVRVTQATLSRDLHDLGLFKGPSGYLEADAPAAGAASDRTLEQMERMMRSYLTGVACAGNLVVLKTSAGLAHALGVALDRAALPQVVGTVSGDDTLFAATPSPSRARALEHRLRGLLGRR
ncbi:MAG: ArgR family transcriptional regulator [Acidobacteriota bacterium]